MVYVSTWTHRKSWTRSLMYGTSHSKYSNGSVIQHEMGILGADRSNGDLHRAILRWAVINK